MIDFRKTVVLSLYSLILMLLVACQPSDSSNDAATTKADATTNMTAIPSGQSKGTWIIPSPNQQIQFKISNANPDGGARALQYQVTLKDEIVIEPSSLGLVRNDQSFGENLKLIAQSNIQQVTTRGENISGKRSFSSAIANESTLTFESAEGAKMELIVRAYDNGVAFRYRFPESSSQTYTITQELTAFDLPAQGRAWMQPYDSVGTYQPAYETFYENNLRIGREAGGQFNGWAFPALFNINGSKHWLLISESGLDRHYCGMHLNAKATDGRYQMALPLATEGEGLGAATPSSTLPWTMPWRFITIGDNLKTIFESEMANILAPKSQLTDVSWIQPGVSSWSWWSDSDSPKQYNSLKKFVDLSAEMNWKYTLVDANWDQMKGGNLEKLAQYAQSKKVGLLVWYNSGGPHNKVTEAPRDLMFDASTRRAEFKKLQKMGVKGVKVDFWQSDKQQMIQYYLDLLEDAAAHQLVVNFHGCTVPRGWTRTYPNLLTMEAVRGAEAYKFDPQFPAKAALQNSILPFTRNVVGPMDYTPVTYSDSKYKRLTTMGHETALAILFESGIVHLADQPSAYQKLPIEARLLFKYLPTAWDDTRFLLGWPGKEVIIARKSKALWYVAGVNGENKTKTRKVDLRSLDSGLFEIEYTHDDPSGKGLVTTYMQVQAFQPVSITLPPYGGFVMKIRKP